MRIFQHYRNKKLYQTFDKEALSQFNGKWKPVLLYTQAAKSSWVKVCILNFLINKLMRGIPLYVREADQFSTHTVCDSQVKMTQRYEVNKPADLTNGDIK